MNGMILGILCGDRHDPVAGIDTTLLHRVLRHDGARDETVPSAMPCHPCFSGALDATWRTLEARPRGKPLSNPGCGTAPVSTALTRAPHSVNNDFEHVYNRLQSYATILSSIA